LHFASSAGKIDIIKLLHSKSMDLHARDMVIFYIAIQILLDKQNKKFSVEYRLQPLPSTTVYDIFRTVTMQ
jgi:hypothetical protein